MALTLPYPGMDFVPLDVLTAAEQDQLVANIEYIANQFPIGASNIADGSISTTKLATDAITPSKVDFATFNNVKHTNDASLTVGPGTWLIVCTAYLIQTAQGSLAEIDYELRAAGIRINGTNRIWQVGSNSAARMFDTITIIIPYTAVQNTAISFATTKTTNGSVSRYDIAAIPMYS